MQTQPKGLTIQNANKLLKKAEENGDRQLLFRIWRETEDDRIRCAAYEDLIRSEKQVRFGSMEWIRDAVETGNLEKGPLRQYGMDRSGSA